MADTDMDFGGLTFIVEDIKVGATAPGQAGTSLSSTELLYLDGLTIGTVSASKAVVVDSNKDITGFRNTSQTGTFTVGVDDTGADVKFFGATASKSWLWDESLDKMVVTGATDLLGAVTVGVDGTGHDVIMYGDTAGCNFTWDQSADQVVLTRTSASTDGGTSVEPFYMTSTMTGAGGVGGRARFRLDTNVALGSWSNALKAHTVYGASGKTTGLGSAFVAELDLSAGTVDGTYAPVEIELNVPSGASLGTQTSLMYMSVNGADKATFDTSGALFNLAGVSAGDTKMFDNTVNITNVNEITAGLRVIIAGAEYYILLATKADVDDA